MNNPEETAEGAGAELVARLSAISAKMKAGDYNNARANLFNGHWVAGAPEADLPPGVLARAVALTDAVHAALTLWPPDIPTAEAQLAAALKLMEEASSR